MTRSASCRDARRATSGPKASDENAAARAAIPSAASPAVRSPSAAVAAERSPARRHGRSRARGPGCDCTSGRASVSNGSTSPDPSSATRTVSRRTSGSARAGASSEGSCARIAFWSCFSCSPGSSPSSSSSSRRSVLEALERVGLAPGAVQGEHQLAVEPLAVRVLRDECLEVGDELVVPAEREVGLHALLERDQPQLLQARDLGGERNSRRTRSARARRRARAPGPRAASAADRARLGSHWASLDELLEAGQVELVRADLEHVARRAGDQGVPAERLAEPPDLDLQDLRRRRRRTLPPQRRSISVSVETTSFARSRSSASSERCFGPPSGNRPVLVDHLERSENAVVHVAPSVAGGA